MKLSKFKVAFTGAKRQRTFCCNPLSTLALLCASVFIGSTFIVTDSIEKFSALEMLDSFLGTGSRKCKENCGPIGTEALPRGIVSSASDLEMRPLWGASTKKKVNTMNLLAMSVGIEQKESVDKIVKKFIGSNFVVMLFHYDGNVDDWEDFEWCARALHIAASNQTKWWFAKRFLHPDIVSEYAHIFLWDEDLGVESFNVRRYLSVIKTEGLEISQPALQPDKSEFRHELTATQMMHRWVEMTAPVFSKAAWRCTWYLIQNDVVDAWGVDFRLGYCAQGDPAKNIGIVDSGYVVHFGLPTLGGASEKMADGEAEAEATSQAAQNETSLDSLEGVTLTSNGSKPDPRNAVLKQSLTDLEKFENQWKKAVKDDDS